MTKEQRSKIIREKTGQIVNLARSKHFHEEEIKVACMLAICDEMNDAFGDAPEALDKCYELCEQCDDAEHWLQAMTDLLNIN